jgi:DNA-binding transcriptional MocR family regulator
VRHTNLPTDLDGDGAGRAPAALDLTVPVTARSARGIADTIASAVAEGELAPGTRLPTVRRLAATAGVNPATVAEAWRLLAQRRVIETRGSRGTFVAEPGDHRVISRFWQLAGRAGSFAVDLSTGMPDTALLPPLGPALRRVGSQHQVSSYLDRPVLPELEEHLRRAWEPCFEPEALTMVNGALDALDRVTAVTVRPGEQVIVENPTFPPLLDLLQLAGVRVVGIPVDAEGPRLDALDRALRTAPTAMFLQPRAHNPTGVSTTPERMAAVAALVGPHDGLLVVEDDHQGDIASAPPVSLGRHLPHRTVRIQSFSKSHGPDLRLAAVGGPAAVIDPLTERMRLGPSWSSRLLQHVLVDMLTHEGTRRAVDRARRTYAERRRRLVAALAERGVATTGTDGINLWVPTAGEADTLLILASHGIGAAPGSPFFVDKDDTTRIRVTCGLLAEGFDAMADLLAQAAFPSGSTRAGAR